MTSIAIAGVPRAGKTTLALSLPDVCVLHTDDLIGKMDWSAQSEEVSYWFDAQKALCIEGMTIPRAQKAICIEGMSAPRAIRKWLARNPTGKPCDVVYWLSSPRIPLTPKQHQMGVQATKHMLEIWDELVSRGVEIRNKQ